MIPLPSGGAAVVLKPCPFCGGSDIRWLGYLANSLLRCEDCGTTSDDGSRERIIALWNRRTADPVREELGQAPPQTAAHPSRVASGTLRLTVDHKAGAAYLYLRKIEAGGVNNTIADVVDDVHMDFDHTGKLIGIEFLDLGILPEAFLHEAEDLATRKVGAERSGATTTSSNHPRTGSPKESA